MEGRILGGPLGPVPPCFCTAGGGRTLQGERIPSCGLTAPSFASFSAEPTATEENQGEPTADQLFHIAQEAVRNAVKHAHARRITIGLTDNGAIRLWVHDDGVGIDAKNGRPDGLGLRIMRHRAALLGAALEVRRAEESGTLVLCTLSAAKG